MEYMESKMQDQIEGAILAQAEKDTGGPAFPGMAEKAFGQDTGHQEGMKMRDYFAGQALAGWMSGLRAAQVVEIADQNAVAVGMYSMADAMLAARQA